MGLKSREIDHLLIRQLKLTANKPVTGFVLLRTVSRWAHKLISCYNSSVISTFDSYLSTSEREAQLSTDNHPYLFKSFSKIFPGLNFALKRGRIKQASPVRGLRPSRADCSQR